MNDLNKKYATALTYIFKFYNKPIDEELLGMWIEFFIKRDITPETLKEASEKCMENEMYLTSPASIYKYLPKVNAYLLIKQALRKFGIQNSTTFRGGKRYSIKDAREQWLINEGGLGMIAAYNEYVDRVNVCKEAFKPKLEKDINEVYNKNKQTYKKRDTLYIQDNDNLKLPSNTLLIENDR